MPYIEPINVNLLKENMEKYVKFDYIKFDYRKLNPINLFKIDKNFFKIHPVEGKLKRVKKPRIPFPLKVFDYFFHMATLSFERNRAKAEALLPVIEVELKDMGNTEAFNTGRISYKGLEVLE